MTLEELAQRLGLKSTGSLRVQIQRGSLRADRVGKRTYVVSDEEATRYEHGHKGRAGRRPILNVWSVRDEMQRANEVLNGKREGSAEEAHAFYAWFDQYEVPCDECTQRFPDLPSINDAVSWATDSSRFLYFWNVDDATYRVVAKTRDAPHHCYMIPVGIKEVPHVTAIPENPV